MEDRQELFGFYLQPTSEIETQSLSCKDIYNMEQHTYLSPVFYKFVMYFKIRNPDFEHRDDNRAFRVVHQRRYKCLWLHKTPRWIGFNLKTFEIISLEEEEAVNYLKVFMKRSKESSPSMGWLLNYFNEVQPSHEIIWLPDEDFEVMKRKMLSKLDINL